MIAKRGAKWVVLDSSGKKVLGEHDSEESAKKQLGAIEASKAKKMELDGTEYVFDFETDLQTISDVDIFAVGNWRGVNSPPEGDKYEEKDLQSMIDAFNAGVMKPHIKITHGSDQEQVDIGRVSNLKIKAGKLFADFINVPKALYELMKKGLFKARSAEVLWNLRQGDKTWPRVLKAVALLAPGQKPAVSAISEGYQFEAIYCYAMADRQDDLEGQYIVNIIEHKEVDMLEKLAKKYGIEESEVESFLDQKMAELQEATEKAEKVNQYEAERQAMRQERVKTFIDGLVKEGKVLPKHQEKFQSQLNKLYESGMEEEAKELETVLSDMPNMVEFEEKSKDKGEDASIMRHPAAEVNRAGMQLVKEGKAKDYHSAMEVIQKERPKLWSAYLKGLSEYTEDA